VDFEFGTAGRIVFGEGRLREVGSIALALGRRALVVQSERAGAHGIVALLQASGIVATELRVSGEPTVALAERGTRQAREAGCDLVVAIGGGSAIDAGKAVAALITNRAPVRDYLEVVGPGKPLTERPAPFIAVPTTAGTGAEVTRNAVLSVEDARMKVSLRSALMFPSVAIVDPQLTYSLPPSITASTGMDALTQCIEPFVTPKATPLTDAVAREGMRRAAGALERAVRGSHDTEARRDMSIASLCGGLALTNAKLGAVHGFAAPLGGMFPVPHGVACARLLAPVVGANVRALRARAPDSPALARYDEVARILTRDGSARAEDAEAWLRELTTSIGIPALATYGIGTGDIEAIVGRARRASSMQGNPIGLTDAELSEALAAAL